MLTKLRSADQQVAPGQEDMEDIKEYNQEEAEGLFIKQHVIEAYWDASSS
jgi:hypothetical protein